MTVARLVLVLDCTDPAALAAFWKAALDYRLTYDGADPYVVMDPPLERTGPGWPQIILQQVPEAKGAKNRMHFDLRVDDLEGEVDRLLALGATRLTERPLEEEPFRWHVLADIEGNEFCVVAALHQLTSSGS